MTTQLTTGRYTCNFAEAEIRKFGSSNQYAKAEVLVDVGLRWERGEWVNVACEQEKASIWLVGPKGLSEETAEEIMDAFEWDGRGDTLLSAIVGKDCQVSIDVGSKSNGGRTYREVTIRRIFPHSFDPLSSGSLVSAFDASVEGALAKIAERRAAAARQAGAAPGASPASTSPPPDTSSSVPPEGTHRVLLKAGALPEVWKCVDANNAVLAELHDAPGVGWSRVGDMNGWQVWVRSELPAGAGMDEVPF